MSIGSLQPADKEEFVLLFVPVAYVIVHVATGKVPVATRGKPTMGSANAVPDRRPHYMTKVAHV